DVPPPHCEGNAVTRALGSNVDQDVAGLGGSAELEGDARIAPDRVVVGPATADGHRGGSLRAAESIPPDRDERALAVLTACVGSAHQIGKEDANAGDGSDAPPRAAAR